MNRQVLSAHFFIFLATCFTSMNYSIAKIVMPSEIHPYSIVLTRIIISVAFFFILDALLYPTKKYHLPFQDIIRLISCGVVGVALNQLTLYKGLSITTPINAALIVATIPIFVLILSALFLRNLPSWKQSLGVLISASGAYYLIMYTSGGLEIKNLTGDLLILMNCISYAIYLVLVKPLLEKYHPLFLTKWMFAVAALVVFPFTIQDTLRTDWFQVSTEGWLAYTYIILFATLFNYYFTTSTLKWLNPVTTAAYGYLQPFLATLFAVCLGLDVLSTEKAIAGGVIFFGIVLTGKWFQRNSDQEKKE
ncbi:MAG: transrane permease [Chitinophagaceae bacterium]|nr:transrane permease [Chitinophagaceae bacterium]